MDTIDFNEHDVDIFINGTWQKYVGSIGWLFIITRLLELCFWSTRNRSQPSQLNLFPLWREPCFSSFFKHYMMVEIYQPIKLQKTDTPKSISNIGKSWKDLFAYQFFALTRQHLKTENTKLNINWYTQYLMKSTFETIWLFFHRPVI
jgi:hypothetical protein